MLALGTQNDCSVRARSSSWFIPFSPAGECVREVVLGVFILAERFGEGPKVDCVKEGGPFVVEAVAVGFEVVEPNMGRYRQSLFS